MTFPIIDSHQHIWDPSRAEYDWLGPGLEAVDREFTFAELLPALREAGVDYTVQVQSADNAEDTRLMIDSAARHPQVAGIVAYAPLDDPRACADVIEPWEEDDLIVGARTLIHNQSDPDWLLRDDVNEGLSRLSAARLSFDVVAVLPRHLEHVPTLAARHPDLRLVIDHLAKPPIGLRSDEPWRGLLAAAAEYPNVFAKVSGLYSATDDMTAWTPALVEPFLDHALDVFGTKRLMYGGDWPISLMTGGYLEVWRGLEPLFEQLSFDEREDVLGRTAATFYRLSPGRLAASPSSSQSVQADVDPVDHPTGHS